MSDQEAPTSDHSVLLQQRSDDSRKPGILESCQQMISSQTPNFLRLYLNPWVAQVCLCLEHLSAPLLRFPNYASERCPSFLCNSRYEALAGAIKLIRYTRAQHRPVRQRDTNGSVLCIIVDDEDAFVDFAATQLRDGRQVQFIPDIVRCRSDEVAGLLEGAPETECIVYAGQAARTSVIDLSDRPGIMSIRCVDAQTVESLEVGHQIQASDVIVFDESFVNFDVPFAAFSTCRSLYSSWMKRSMSLFHSTTFQPSTLPAMHFMKCLQHRSPRLLAALRQQLDAVMADRDARHGCYRALYSESLSRLIQVTGFDRVEPTVSGHLISMESRAVFDGVAGVACSVRGHNPVEYVDDIRHTQKESGGDLQPQLQRELKSLGSPDQWVPAVSGASAVECALKLALTAQPDRPHVVTLEGGFGGKTLLALTGTSKPFYRKNVGPLYPDVTRVNPRSPSAVADLDQIFESQPVGVVQLELIQGVGGVRAVPSHVLDHLLELRRQHSCLLFVDEVQTGMFRTGPFLRSRDLGFTPDLVTIGKGTSDMMFPFAAALYNERVRQLLESTSDALPQRLQGKSDYPVGCAALLNTLRAAQREDWSGRVRQQATLFQQLLTDGLRACPNVREIRVYGMLIGIELQTSQGINGLIGSRLAKFFSLAMLHHPKQPLLMGFCQYEPGVFKLTPGLLMEEQQIRSVCATIVEALSQPVLATVARGVSRVLRNRLALRGRPEPVRSLSTTPASAESHELLQRPIS